MIVFDREKFADVVHHIIERCSGNPAKLGKVRLNKSLYFSDMVHYLWRDVPLTGAEYVKQPFGPVAVALSDVVEELRVFGRIDVQRVERFGFAQWHLKSRVPLESNRISEDEFELLGDVTDFVCDHTANVISELSHGPAWESRSLHEVIPYESAYMMVPYGEITDADVAQAREEFERIRAERRAAS